MLKICNNLFEDLNRNEIKYCHWKSNEHLEEGLNGDTDLDILIDKTKYFKIIELLNKYKFKRYNTISYLKYCAIEDFIGVDIESGKMIHLHLHYELTLGRKFIKEYHLPFENYIYNNLIYDNENKMYVIDPNIEMILLIIRFIMKKRSIGINNKDILNNEFKIEFEWLLKRINYEKIQMHSVYLMGEEFTDCIISFIKNSKNINLYKKLKHITFEIIDKYRSGNKIVLQLKYFLYKGLAGVNCISAKKFNLPIPYRRTLPEGGKIIVFIGVDGSGKSTLMKETTNWLKWKLDVYRMYFGSGDGSCSLLRMPLLIVAKRMQKKKMKNKDFRNLINNENEIVSAKTKDKFAYKSYKTFWAISLALEKKKKIKKIWKAKSKGLYVICDRYPQINVLGYNDGPLLYDWIKSHNKLKQIIGKWEYDVYKLATSITPDIVIKLNITEETSHKRKPDTPMAMIKKKIEAVDKMTFGESCKVYKVNTERVVDEALYDIKRIIWGDVYE